MAQKKFSELVDRGYALVKQIKPLDDELDEIKKKLKAHGKERKLELIEGKKAECKFGIQPTPSANPKKVYDVFEDQDRVDDFWDCIAVKMTELKAALGTTQAGKLIKIKRDPWGRVKFVKK